MIKKNITILIINVFVLNIILFNLGLNFNVEGSESEIKTKLTSKFTKSRFDPNYYWKEIEVISEPVEFENINIKFSWNPDIAVENDKIYVVWQDSNKTHSAGEDEDIFFRYFDGNFWSSIQVISEPSFGQNNNVGWSMHPRIAVENGNIYVVWEDNNNTNNAGFDNDIFFRCNISGKGWGEIQVISEPIPGQNINIGYTFGNSSSRQTSALSVDNDSIYVVWTDNNNTNNAGLGDDDIFFRNNLSGNGWGEIQVISEPVFGQNYNTGNCSLFGGPKIIAENCKLFVVWDDDNNTNNAGIDTDIFYRYFDGKLWSNIQVISEPVIGKNVNIGRSENPDIAVEKGRIYVVWEDINNTDNAGTDADIFLKCNLSGSFWEPVQIISEPYQGQDVNTRYSGRPDISIYNGEFHIVWEDFNNTNGAGTSESHIFYRNNITEFGWENIQVISQPIYGKDLNTGHSDFPQIASGNGEIKVVWDDSNLTSNSGIDLDIHYRSKQIMGLRSPSVTPNNGNSSSIFNFTVTYIHRDNLGPEKVTVNISNKEYPMLEIDPSDTNYTDGKQYFFNTKILDIGVRNYEFRAYLGIIPLVTTLHNKPIVYNTPPHITTIDLNTAIEKVYYEADYNYEDIDITNVGQIGYWNCSTNAGWLKFYPSNAIINGTPTNDDVGECWVNITISDTIDIDFTNFTLTVINVNDGPIIITNDIVATNEDDYYEVDYEAIDIDTPVENLIWTMDTNASWLDFESTTSVLNGTPKNDDVGNYWVNITVSDLEYIDYTQFILTVININDPPEIITNDIATATEDEFYEVTYKALDVDSPPDELFWTITTNAEWLMYDLKSAIISGTPTNNDVGKYWVNIIVSDTIDIDFTNFTLTVENTNDLPIIATEDKNIAKVDELYSVYYTAEDIDPPPVTFIWFLRSNASSWLSINKVNGWLHGTPNKIDTGSYWVNVSVTDGNNGWDYHNFTLQVSIEMFLNNNIPELSNVSMIPPDGNIKIEFIFSIDYYDEDGDAPEFIQFVIDNETYNMEFILGKNPANGGYKYAVSLSEGNHTYYFITSDGFGIVRTDNFTTPYIKNVDEYPEENNTKQDILESNISWYWLYLIVIIIIIIILVTILFIYKKRKVAKAPTKNQVLIDEPTEHEDLTNGVIDGEEE